MSFIAPQLAGLRRIDVPSAARGALRLIATLFFVIFAIDGSAQSALLFDGADGATCDYFNRGAQIRWRHRLGDWKDAQGAEQGDASFARASVTAADKARIVTFDVTALVQGWVTGKNVNAGLLARGAQRGGVAVFHSREAAGVDSRPRLVLALQDGNALRLSPSADTTLDCSTVSSLGLKDTISVGRDRQLLIQFDLAKVAGMRVSTATLELVTTDKQFGDTSVELYRLDPHLPNKSIATKPELGLAAKYPRDRGIQRDSDVIMATGFESAAWQKDWNFGEIRGTYEQIGGRGAPAIKFEPLDGPALQVMIPAGQNLGLDMRYKFSDKLGKEPEEVYFRYYLRLGNDWNPTTDGGKLPGITSTYGVVGWGGRKADAMKGWSMRGSFFRLPGPANPYHAFTPIGTYAYHADTEDFWGDAWAWSESGHALLERNRWYCIEQYVMVNQPGHKDAVIRAWVDGQLVFEHTGFRVRDIPSIKIEQIWMNVYYGGTAPSPQDQHLFIDNVVIARRYIGPMKE